MSSVFKLSNKNKILYENQKLTGISVQLILFFKQIINFFQENTYL